MLEFSKKINIDGKIVGQDEPVYIIAEAGVSHFGNEDKAYKLVDLAADSGADSVKFQVFDVNAMISNVAGEWVDRMRSRQLPYQAFERIQAYCREKNITFFATPHDEPSMEFLASIDVPVFKIGSGEVGNWPYLAKIASLGKPVIFSTGMYQIDQIGDALNAISETGNRDIAVLHCVTEYPAPPYTISLGNIELVAQKFGVITGYSDHTEGFHIPLASVATGARIIEKHISLDFHVPDAQDWKVSCGPRDLGDFVHQVREIEAALGLRDSGPTEGERRSILWASKSLVAKHDIPAGTILKETHFLSKRPGGGVSPADIKKAIGRTTKVSLQTDQLIKWEMLD